MSEMKIARYRPSQRKVKKAAIKSQMIGELERESQFVVQKSRQSRVPMEIKASDDNPLIVRKFRYRRASAGSANVTADSLANLMVVGRGSASFTRFFGTVRLLKVELWTTTTANVNGSNNASLEFFSDLGSDVFDQGPSQVFETVSSGTSLPGHLKVRPGVLCKAGRAIVAGQAAGGPYVVFRSLGNPGDIVEVTVEFTLCNAGQMAGHSLTGSGGFAGFVQENTYLDNTSTSTTAGSQIMTSLSAYNTAVAFG